MRGAEVRSAGLLLTLNTPPYPKKKKTRTQGQCQHQSSQNQRHRIDGLFLDRRARSPAAPCAQAPTTPRPLLERPIQRHHRVNDAHSTPGDTFQRSLRRLFPFRSLRGIRQLPPNAPPAPAGTGWYQPSISLDHQISRSRKSLKTCLTDEPVAITEEVSRALLARCDTPIYRKASFGSSTGFPTPFQLGK